MLSRTQATRYVTPLREGGSLPGVMEGADLGTWVVKFRGAGQGLKVLVAEVIVGELARALELDVPVLTVIDLPEAIAKYEADEEVQDLLTASVGSNLGLDLLPGAFPYDGSAPPPPDVAARILCLDAFTANVDRTPHNPNLIRWHGRTWLIDHGAALYFHHGWPRKAPDPQRFARQPFDSSTHILRGVADGVPDALGDLRKRATDETLRAAVDCVPEEWLETTSSLTTADEVRNAYVAHLIARRDQPEAWQPRESA
ncbi:HipA family kinase [Demetria terragena]|uniref:HipA family kinase n=1 Tax=Demetria terragena TaxID=63959 RepID=UPI0004755133|nr:HipA family kinase [Demetria terragena]